MLLKIKFLQQCCSLNDNSIKPRIETGFDGMIQVIQHQGLNDNSIKPRIETQKKLK